MMEMVTAVLEKYWQLAVGFSVGSILVWLKDCLTISKLKAEIKKLKGEKLMQLHTYEEKYSDVMKQIRELAKQIELLWEAQVLDQVQLNAARDKMCCLVEDAIVAYSHAAEFQSIMFDEDKVRANLLVEETVAEFRRWKSAVRTVNLPNLLEALGGKEPLRISNRAVRLLASAVSKTANVGEKQQLLEEISGFMDVANPEGAPISVR